MFLMSTNDKAKTEAVRKNGVWKWRDFKVQILCQVQEQFLERNMHFIDKVLYHSTRWHGGKESACQCRRCWRCEFDPWVEKIPWRRKWQPTPVFLPGKSHGEMRLTGYSPCGCKESCMQVFIDIVRNVFSQAKLNTLHFTWITIHLNTLHFTCHKPCGNSLSF